MTRFFTFFPITYSLFFNKHGKQTSIQALTSKPEGATYSLLAKGHGDRGIVSIYYLISCCINNHFDVCSCTSNVLQSY
jgi:hypothetical protein